MSVKSAKADGFKSVDSGASEPTPTPTLEPKVEVSGTKGIRATITSSVAARLEAAEESTSVDRGVLVEMALESLFKLDEKERLALYESVIAKRVKATVSMKF